MKPRSVLSYAAASLALAFSLHAYANDNLRALAAANQGDQASVDCASAVEDAPSMNGAQLFLAVQHCVDKGLPDDAVFLVITGQIRSFTDIVLLQPETNEAMEAATKLYGALYYIYGGAGPDELYLDAERTRLLFERLRDWQPSYTAGYRPGWEHAAVEPSRYNDALRYNMQSRVAQLRRYASLVNNDAYLHASREHQEFLKRNAGTISFGSEDAKRATELRKAMEGAANELPPRQYPLLPSHLKPSYEPDPDADFEQVYVGFNGPATPGGEAFATERDVQASWLGNAIDPDELDTLVGAIAFDEQMLVVLSFGERPTATGEVIIYDIRTMPLGSGLYVSGVVGVNSVDCDYESSSSYPFAVAIAPRIDTGKVTGASFFNTANGCKPPKQGNPTKVENDIGSDRL